jgi:hypothetical protein
LMSSPVHACRFGRECVENGWIAAKQSHAAGVRLSGLANWSL